MKRLLLIVLPLLLIVGCSKPISEETLIDEDGLKYHPDTKELYSGEVFTNFMGGKPKLEGSYKDGLMNGNWVGWYENGQKEWEGKYKNGDGSDLGNTGVPKNGRSGLWTLWYENGNKKSENVFKDEIISTSTFYDKDKTGIMLFKNFYGNGELKNVNYFDIDGGIKNPINIEDLNYTNSRYFDKKTNKEYFGYVKDKQYDVGENKELELMYGLIGGILRHGKFIVYYDNGSKKLSTTFNLEKIEGHSTSYSPDGKDSTKMFFKEDKPWTGFETEWYLNGNFKKQVTLEDGENILEEDWYENGQKSFEGTFKDGDLISYKQWNEDGSVIE